MAKKTRASELFAKYPEVFSAMYEHSIDEVTNHADDNNVIFNKILANAEAGKDTYWVPECDKKALYKDAQDLAEKYSVK